MPTMVTPMGHALWANVNVSELSWEIAFHRVEWGRK